MSETVGIGGSKPKITDRELLAICNLCNLKLQYANLTKTISGSTKTSPHTIYSLLEGTIKAIKDKAPEDSPFNYEYGEQPENRKKDKDGKIVVRPVYEDKYKITRAPQDGDENTEPDRALVKTAMDMLKEEAGLLFGYFLQCKNEMLVYN